jgi:opacity protein-like surface antigen
MKKNLYFVCLFTLISLSASAQRWSYGAGLGGTLYHGDLANWNFFPNLKELSNTKPSVNLQVIYQRKSFFDYRLQIAYTGLSGNVDNRISPPVGGFIQTKFTSSLIQIDGLIDYNFLDYQSNRKIVNWSPYVYVGLSGVLAKVSGVNNGASFNSSMLPVMAFPYGLGIKYQVNSNLGLQLEGGSRKAFSSALDSPRDTSVSNYDLFNGDQYLFTSISLIYTFQSIFCPTD